MPVTERQVVTADQADQRLVLTEMVATAETLAMPELVRMRERQTAVLSVTVVTVVTVDRNEEWAAQPEVVLEVQELLELREHSVTVVTVATAAPVRVQLLVLAALAVLAVLAVRLLAARVVTVARAVLVVHR
jgi:hypothetical protein